MWLFPQSRFGHFRCRKRKSKTTFLLSLYTGYYGVFLMSRSEKKRQRILGFNLPILILSFLDVLASLGSMLESQSVPGPQNQQPRNRRLEDQRHFGRTKKLGAYKKVAKVKVYIIFADFALYGRRTKIDFKDWDQVHCHCGSLF